KCLDNPISTFELVQNLPNKSEREFSNFFDSVQLTLQKLLAIGAIRERPLSLRKAFQILKDNEIAYLIKNRRTLEEKSKRLLNNSKSDKFFSPVKKSAQPIIKTKMRLNWTNTFESSDEVMKRWKTIDKTYASFGSKGTSLSIFNLHHLLLKAGYPRTSKAVQRNLKGKILKIHPLVSNLPMLYEAYERIILYYKIQNPKYLGIIVHALTGQIHFFPDGNGRLARLLEKWYMKQSGFSPAYIFDPELICHFHYEEYRQRISFEKSPIYLDEFIHWMLDGYSSLIVPRVDRRR
ncbi:MAG: Fic family protein, partial [Bdellovibrionales bacterium]|nr:Fic family protein [Bdellovibrionales bacterium]